MASTCLQLIQQATGELGLDVPAFVAGNLSQDTIQQFALLNAVGYELQQQFDWEHAVTPYRFTTEFLTTTGDTIKGSAVVTNIPDTSALVAGSYMALGAGINRDVYINSIDSATQVTLNQLCTANGLDVTINFCKTKYTFPSDYDRPIDQTQWDKTKHWQMMGPVSAKRWEYLQSGTIATGPRLNYRIFGGTFQIWPPTASNEYIGFEYMSKNWAFDVNGTAKSSFTLDTDTCVYADRMMVLGLKMKYFEIKGFDTTALNRDFTAQVSNAKAANGASEVLHMAPRMNSRLITQNQIPDLGYGPQ